MLVGLAVIRAELRRLELPADFAFDLVLGTVIVGMLGSKLAFVAVQVGRGLGPADWQLISGEGWVIAGGLLGALTFYALYARWRRLPAALVLDVGLVGASLAHGVGRLGCFMTGCCYGTPSELPWAVRFDHPLTAAPRDVALHPTQLYDAAASFVLFAILWRLRARKRFDGQLAVIALAYYAVVRSLLELVRGDRGRGLYAGGEVSFSQLLAPPALVLALGLYLRWRGRPLFEKRHGRAPASGRPPLAQARSGRRRRIASLLAAGSARRLWPDCWPGSRRMPAAAPKCSAG